MKWRLTSELTSFFIAGTKRVYLASVENKKYTTEVIKLIGSDTYQELRIYENQFKIRFRERNNTLVVEIKADEFPTDSWYVVENFYTDSVWELLESHTIINGDFPEDLRFEVSFEESHPVVKFVEPSMKNFKTYFDEMRRRMNCELCKKTVKFQIGHRYDTLTESFIIVSQTKSRLLDINNSEYTEGDKMPNVFLYVNELREGEKTCNDVLKTRALGPGPDDIKILYGKKSMVDVGKVLENDFSGNIRDYWDNLYENSGNNLKDVLSIFSITNTDDPIILSDYVKNGLEEKTMDILQKLILDNWNIGGIRTDLFIGEEKEFEENISHLKNLFLTSGIQDGNFLKKLYYSKLYKELGIDLIELSKTSLEIWNGLVLDDDFDTYIKYQSYYSNPSRFKFENNGSRQRIKSTKYKLDVITLRDLYGEGELRDAIIETINYVRDNFGLGAAEYSFINIGTKSEPLEYIVCKITLDNILEYKNMHGGLSETLKNEILKNHFVWVQVTFDKDCELL